MQNVIREENRRKLDRPITGIIQEDRIWEQWYDQKIFQEKFPKLNQRDFLFQCNEGYENQVIINNRGLRKITVSNFEKMVNQYVESLKLYGINKGEIVCTIGLSTPELLALKYACSTLGIITSNLNFMDANFMASDLNRLYSQIKMLSPRAIFVLDILESNVSEILNQPEFHKICKVRMPLSMSTPLLNFERAKIFLLSMKNKIDDKKINNCISLKKFLSCSKMTDDLNISVYEPRMASNISFTSGTTGQNKAVVLSHDANNALAFQHKLADLGLVRGAKHLALVPPFLAFWDSDITHMAMCMGVENILELSLSYENIPKYLTKYLPQYGIWSQYLWDSMLHLPQKQLEEVSNNLKKVVVGGERCEINQAESFYNMTGIVQEAGYGATEVNTCFSVANPNCNVVGSAGIPLPFNNVRIVDDDFQDLTYNQSGRLLISSPCMMNGYYGKEELTNQVLIQDSKGVIWYDTKDYAYVDNNGNLYVLDRDVSPITIKDFDGESEKIKLLDIVEKIKSDRCIKICKLSSYNNYIVLHVVIDEFYDLSQDEAILSIKNTIMNNLPEKYWPSIINVVATLPRTSVGKVDYQKLNEETENLCNNEFFKPFERLQVLVEGEVKKNVKVRKKHI